MYVNHNERGGFDNNENKLKKKQLRNTQIKLSKSIQRTNLCLSEHPLSGLL